MSTTTPPEIHIPATDFLWWIWHTINNPNTAEAATLIAMRLAMVTG